MRNYSENEKLHVIEILSVATGLQIPAKSYQGLDVEIDRQIQEFADTFEGDMNAIIPLIVRAYRTGFQNGANWLTQL